MSLHIELRVNEERIGGVTVKREHDDNGTDHDSINTYQWTYMRSGSRVATNTIQHRYGDGAVALAHKVLGEIVLRHEIAAGSKS